VLTETWVRLTNNLFTIFLQKVTYPFTGSYEILEKSICQSNAMSLDSYSFADDLIRTNIKDALQDIPGPFAPPFKMRPSLNMMARSYSFIICNEELIVMQGFPEAI